MAPEPLQKAPPIGPMKPTPCTGINATVHHSTITLYEMLVEKLEEDQKEEFHRLYKQYCQFFGLPDSAVPKTHKDFEAYMDDMITSDILTVGETAKTIARDLFAAKGVLYPLLQGNRIITAHLLPPKLREAYGLPPDTPENRRLFERKVASPAPPAPSSAALPALFIHLL